MTGYYTIGLTERRRMRGVEFDVFSEVVRGK
jgi:hypothetical protein